MSYRIRPALGARPGLSAEGSRRRLVIGAAAAGSAAIAGLAGRPARAERADWPIRLLVGFAPGGGTDIVGRAIAPRLSELLGAQVVIENRPGAAGTIAAEMAAKAPPDGRTLVVGHANPNAIAPNVYNKVGFDPAKDFSAITYIGYVPNVLVINPALPARDVKGLIELAKAREGKLTFASSGVGSTQHLAGELFQRIAGVKMTHIPYKGSGQAITDLLAHQVDSNFDTMPPVLPHIQSGKLRALAISTPRRMPQLPDVPTFDEVGIKGFDVTNWYAIMGPAGIPAAEIERIDAAVRKTLGEAEVRGRLEPQGILFEGPATPAEFDAFIKAELAKYARMTKELGVKGG